MKIDSIIVLNVTGSFHPDNRVRAIGNPTSTGHPRVQSTDLRDAEGLVAAGAGEDCRDGDFIREKVELVAFEAVGLPGAHDEVIHRAGHAQIQLFVILHVEAFGAMFGSGGEERERTKIAGERKGGMVG